MTLTLNTHISSYIQLDVCSYQLSGQGHSRVIIYINYDGQESPMLHTKFRGNRSAGSGEEDFLRFLPYMGVAAILVM